MDKYLLVALNSLKLSVAETLPNAIADEHGLLLVR